MLEFLSNLLNMDLLKYLGAATGLLSGLYTICLLIPGDQPDKIIKMLLDLTEKLSKK